MVKIIFQITDTPAADTGLDALAYMEGDLQVYLHDTLFISLPRTLLLDFAGFAQRWLDNHTAPSAAYLPMNRGEAVLQIDKTPQGEYLFKSARAEKGNFRPVTETAISGAFEAYLEQLEKTLRK
ncbi:hypothetical protein ACFOTA_07885 [Chitinophaga sp. GCM10012297]|uniref:DUF7878 domain-containing protein n=1 Tax=Chitinophaga chungangae TaxID=2821488 RepID=A0ABS3YCU5_9BACT|nr:hypothetical protein [Chitinophaga chungangae]MBO9152123.1 hypothetical protein [Chitinophaga chungangae]